jgi:hypothetical protein
MQASPFQSFQETPIVFVTVQVRFGLPILGDEAAPEILRRAWLQSAAGYRWFVGPYRVLPDRVNLLACPGPAAAPLRAWCAAWKAAAAALINKETGGEGQLWEADARSEPVASAEDYQARCAAMQADPAAPLRDGVFTTEWHGGTIWQLQPGEPPLPAGSRRL